LSADSATKAAKKSQARSRVSNGATLLPGIDGRSTWARRFRDVIEALTVDAGGPDALGEAERSLIRRTAALTVELERMEEAFAAAGAADPDTLDLYGRTSGNLRRLLESLGLQRPARDLPHPPQDPASRSAFDLARRVAFAMQTAAQRGETIIDLEAS
jgi:hypothetical protein